MNQKEPSLYSCCVAEITGTFILVFLGCGAVHTAVTTDGLSGTGQVAIVWGLAVTLSVYATINISGAHINPAITLAFAAWGGFPKNRILPYWISQLIGAALAALFLYLIFSSTIEKYELDNNITRGEFGSQVTASMYGEYFPNPTVEIHAPNEGTVSHTITTSQAILAEVLGTALLAFMVFALTDKKNKGAPTANLAPLFIGATVLVLVSILGPMTQACLNPARDFGPRIVAYFAGWGEIAFPGPNGQSAWDTLLVYLFAPMLGAVIGGLTYTSCIGKQQPE